MRQLDIKRIVERSQRALQAIRSRHRKNPFTVNLTDMGTSTMHRISARNIYRTVPRGILKYALVSASILISGSSFAQQYPERPVTIVVAYPPGGNNDIIARVLASSFSEKFGQPFIVENRPGGAGLIGVGSVAHAEADGYTLLLGVLGANIVAPLTQKDVTFDPANAFTPIAGVSSNPLVVMVANEGPYKTIGDLIEAGRTNGDEINYASTGYGSLSHFASEAFAHGVGATFEHIPYQGGVPAMTALRSREVDFYITAPLPAADQSQPDAPRGLLVTSPDRFAGVPDAPSLTDAGLEEPNVNYWTALFGPAGLPEDVVRKLNAAVQDVLKEPKLEAVLFGAAPMFGTAEEFSAMYQQDIARFVDLIEKTGFNKAPQ